MKTRALSFAITLLSILVLAGCGETKTSNTGGPGSPATPAGGGEDTLSKIKKAGVIKWGADASGGAPFVFGDPKDVNKIVGFEVDMMEKIAKHLGVKEERVQAEWDKLKDNLKDGRSDIVINGIEINESNQKTVNFSQPYFIYEQQLTVRAEDKDKYKSLAELKGHKIGILSGTESANVLKKEGFTEDQTVIHPDSKTPYDNLKLKRVDAVLAESIIAAYYAGKDKELFNVPATFAPGKYGVCVRKEKENDALLVEIDRILKLMKENGELAAIYKAWDILDAKQKDVGIVEK